MEEGGGGSSVIWTVVDFVTLPTDVMCVMVTGPVMTADVNEEMGAGRPDGDPETQGT